MKNIEYRKLVISGIVIIISLIIWIKLFSLQIINETLKISSDNNSQRKVTVYPSRGLIYDRNGKLLVCNEAAYDLMIIPRKLKEFDTLSFCNLLEISIEDFYIKYNKSLSYSRYRPSLFHKQISSRQYALIQEQLYKYPGFFVHNRKLRQYKEGVAAQVLGDIGEIDVEQLKTDSYYRIGDYVGKSGIEKSFEKELRGEKGSNIFLVDVHNNIQGKYMNGKYDSTAISGINISLTLDVELQRYGEMLLNNKIGSIVAIEPSSGEILAMVSSPTYDPELLVGRDRGKNYDSLIKAEGKPLINRAISSSYPPGSIFKIAVSLVGLEENVINKNTFFECDRSKIGCHNHPPCKGVNRAIQYSCNPYFYFTFRRIIQQGKEKSIFRDSRIGLEKWAKTTSAFGFGESLDIGLPNVKKGFVPSIEYYDKLYGKHRWAFSTIYSLAIGQGEVLCTPLQIANLGAIIANKGYYYTPHIAKSGLDEKYLKRNETPIKKKHYDIIIDGMDKVVNEEYGTGSRARIDDIRVCGKTGTVQNPHGKDHSVFLAFAPKDNPQIAIAVYLENAGFGGAHAAPIARLMIEKYINDSISNPNLESTVLNSILFSPKKKENE